MNRQYVTVAGKRWSLLFSTTKELSLLRDAWGFTTDPTGKGRCIVLRKSLAGKQLMETVVHEVLHASAWPIDEDTVERYAADVTRILWRLGFRQVEGTDAS